jgi:release factor glutamine methyltransferase
MELSQALQEVSKRLAAASESPSLDAQTLLAHVLGSSRAWVLAHPEASLTPEQEKALRCAGVRLEAGEPLPYVLGHWEFFGLDYTVSPDVLIPRPETELLVERALEWLRAHPGRRGAADIGTGSGCIAVSLAVNLPDLHVLATDVSLPALEIAKANAEKHNVSKSIRFLRADLINLQPSTFNFQPLDLQPFDLIAANLPYIPTSRLASLAVARREPRLALDGGPDGLDFIRGLMPAVARWLAPGGCCLLEIDASQGEAALDLARSVFPQAKISVIPDLAGLDRLLQVS